MSKASDPLQYNLKAFLIYIIMILIILNAFFSGLNFAYSLNKQNPFKIFNVVVGFLGIVTAIILSINYK